MANERMSEERLGKIDNFYLELKFLRFEGPSAIVIQNCKAIIHELLHEIKNERQRAEKAEARVKELEETAALFHSTYCGTCGAMMQIVRPGKYQCLPCENQEFLLKKVSTLQQTADRMAEALERIQNMRDKRPTYSSAWEQGYSDALGATGKIADAALAEFEKERQ